MKQKLYDNSKKKFSHHNLPVFLELYYIIKAMREGPLILHIHNYPWILPQLANMLACYNKLIQCASYMVDISNLPFQPLPISEKKSEIHVTWNS